jgi:alpha-L-fucosidase
MNPRTILAFLNITYAVFSAQEGDHGISMKGDGSNAVPARSTGAVTVYETAAGKAETKEQYDARMAWWRDAKFGMFIHWDPCSIKGIEISWSRRGTRPLDITGNPVGVVEDPVYDNLYKEFNPSGFNADEWVNLAKESGVRYMVLTCKHHDGFSMWDTKQRDYNIMNTPYGRDIVRQLAAACHKAGMRFGVYYSPRDWTHPDYGQGDNRKYTDFMNAQLTELLSNYGKVDIAWFDSYGAKGDGTTFWHIPETWALIKKLQPQILINDRLSALSRINNPSCAAGDFSTPEQSIGGMNTKRAWESCMTVSAHNRWSWGGDTDGVKTLAECIRMLVLCTCGDGNLLLNVGPRPDGIIDKAQADRLREMGAWLAKYGQSIYGTRGGPYIKGRWGGSTFRGNTVYLHILEWAGNNLKLGPIEGKITTSEVLTGGQATVVQGDKGLDITMDPAGHDLLDTIIKLTLDSPITKVQEDNSERSMFEEPTYGNIISADATLTTSSSAPGNDNPALHKCFFRGERLGFAFHTLNETNPWAISDLGAVKTVKGIHLENHPQDGRGAGIIVSLSTDGKEWKSVQELPKAEEVWEFPVTRLESGAQVPGVQARYVKLEKKTAAPSPMLLRRLEVYGE